MDNQNQNQPEDQNTATDTQKLLTLIKDQNKEIKLSNKKLQKLEDKFIEVNTELKNVQTDKSNIETFLKNIFPKEMHSQLIKEQSGTYEVSELSKLWLIFESKKNSEYQNMLNKLKFEISTLTEQNLDLSSKLESLTIEYENFKKENIDNFENLNFYKKNYDEIKEKNDSLESEKVYLMQVLDEKSKEIEVLKSFEIENAELKAQNLLTNLELNNDNFDYDLNKPNNTTTISNTINTNNSQEVQQLKINTLNNGTQTTDKIYSQDDIDNLQNELNSYKEKFEKIKKDFTDYKEKSHKILMSNEQNYNKILKEHEELKIELSKLLTEKNEEINKNKLAFHNNMKNTQINIERRIDNFDVKNKISNEYLKNILLKYLEAIAIGNEFQSKILEGAIFTILKVSNKEKKQLEEKRYTSSFYYNLWYNAKAFLSAKIYGETKTNDDDDEDNNKGSLNNNVNNINNDKP